MEEYLKMKVYVSTLIYIYRSAVILMDWYELQNDTSLHKKLTDKNNIA